MLCRGNVTVDKLGFYCIISRMALTVPHASFPPWYILTHIWTTSASIFRTVGLKKKYLCHFHDTCNDTPWNKNYHNISASTFPMIGQFRRPRFTVWPAKFKILFELKFFPSQKYKKYLPELIFSIYTVS